MKYVPTVAAALVTTPALAHGGAHLHPHGYETYIAFGAIAAFVLGLRALRK